MFRVALARQEQISYRTSTNNTLPNKIGRVGRIVISYHERWPSKHMYDCQNSLGYVCPRMGLPNRLKVNTLVKVNRLSWNSCLKDKSRISWCSKVSLMKRSKALQIKAQCTSVLEEKRQGKWEGMCHARLYKTSIQFGVFVRYSQCNGQQGFLKSHLCVWLSKEFNFQELNI